MRLANPKNLSRAEQARLRRTHQSSSRAESASQKIANQVGMRRTSRPAINISGFFKSGFSLFKNKNASPNMPLERINNFYPNQDSRHPSIQPQKPSRDIYSLIRKARFLINKPGGLFHRKAERPVAVNMRPFIMPEKNAEAVVQSPKRVRTPHQPFIGLPGQSTTQFLNSSAADSLHMPMAFPVNRNLVIPRMVARAGTATTPLQGRSPSRVRRMLYYTLGSTGVEIKLPALPIFNPGWRLLSGFMVFCLSVAISLMIFAPQFKVTSVEVNGLQRLDPAKIPPILAMNNIRIIDMNPSFVSNQVQESLPELQSVNVSANLPSTVVINIVERQPVMVWEYSNVTLWIDAEGFIIPVHGEVGPLLTVRANVPPAMSNPTITENKKNSLAMGVQIKNNETPEPVVETQKPAALEKIDPELLRASFELNSLLPEGSILIYNNRRGLGWIDSNDINIYVGLKLVDLKLKITEYQVIVDQLIAQGVKPGTISVENLDVPFYRMEK